MSGSFARNDIEVFAPETEEVCFGNNTLFGNGTARAHQSDLVFWWGPWPRKTVINTTFQLPSAVSRQEHTCFFVHSGMNWATHNLYHSLNESEHVFEQIIESTQEPLQELDVIFLQYHPSFNSSLFGQVMKLTLGTKSVSWLDPASPEILCCKRGIFPRQLLDNGITFRQHVMELFGLNQEAVNDYENVLIVQRRLSRRILNIGEIERLFQLSGLSTTLISMEDISLIDQARIVNNHSVVIAAHGAAWGWISLCSRPKSILVELTHVSYANCPALTEERDRLWEKWTIGRNHHLLLSVPNVTVGPRCRAINKDGDLVVDLKEITKCFPNKKQLDAFISGR